MKGFDLKFRSNVTLIHVIYNGLREKINKKYKNNCESQPIITQR